jgi:hypothetical protein
VVRVSKRSRRFAQRKFNFIKGKCECSSVQQLLHRTKKSHHLVFCFVQLYAVRFSGLFIFNQVAFVFLLRNLCHAWFQLKAFLFACFSRIVLGAAGYLRLNIMVCDYHFVFFK